MTMTYWINEIKIVLMVCFAICVFLIRDSFVFIAIKCGFRLEYIFKKEAIAKLYRAKKINFNRIAKLGKLAPDCLIWDLEGKSCRLLDLMKLNRPLVINFGSCT